MVYQGLIDDSRSGTPRSTRLRSRPGRRGLPFSARRLTSLIATDVGPAMRGVNASACLRVPFTVTQPGEFNLLLLRMALRRWFCGLAERRGSGPAQRANHTVLEFRRDRQTRRWRRVHGGGTGPLRPLPRFLRAGTNILAIQGLNVAAADPFVPDLARDRGWTDPDQPFLRPPTPGAANGAGVSGFVADTHFTADRGCMPRLLMWRSGCLPPAPNWSIRWTARSPP